MKAACCHAGFSPLQVELLPEIWHNGAQYILEEGQRPGQLQVSRKLCTKQIKQLYC